MNMKPNTAELQFLHLAYNSFYDLYEEIMDESFWSKDDWHRFSKIRHGYSIYAELLSYEPLKYVIEQLKTARPPMEAEIGSELFKFVRNVMAHFPFYNSWNEVWISKSVINWQKSGQTIDKFLTKYVGKPAVKYRFWESEKNQMTYLSIVFPKAYDDDDCKIWLKDMISEKDGVKFSFILMKKIIDTQVES